MGLPLSDAEKLANDRTTWRYPVHSAQAGFLGYQRVVNSTMPTSP